MELEKIKEEMQNLINTYIPDRQDLIQLVSSWTNIDGIPAKYVFSEIEKYKDKEYSEVDTITIKKIASIFV